MDVSSILKGVLEKEAQFKTTQVNKAIDLTLDLGNLLVQDINPVDEKKIKSNCGDYLEELNRDNVQILLNSLWEIPTETVEDAVVVTLPKPTTEIPREKPLPKARKETRWESYAKLKGIQKRKKERMVWDETFKEYRPVWGYKRANDETKQWLIEVPDNTDPMEDQYEKRKEAKKERVAKNEFQRLKNLNRTSKGTRSSALEPTEKPSKDQISRALEVAKTSTASAGQFTAALPKEHMVKKPKGKKRKFESNTGSITSEKEKQMKVLSSISNKQPRLNTKIAVKHKIMEDHKASREEKQNGNTKASKKLARKQAAILSGKKNTRQRRGR